MAWSAVNVLLTIAVFALSGLCEIGGGWLVWQAVREGAPWWWSIVGGLVLAVYGFVPCLQPVTNFSRIYAVYGGWFIALSYVWGEVIDGVRADRGDIVGTVIALVGVCVALFWPRTEEQKVELPQA